MERKKKAKEVVQEPQAVVVKTAPTEQPVVKERKKIQWKKLGASSYTTKDGQLIQSGETFFAYPEDIPTAFRDVIVPVIDI